MTLLNEVRQAKKLHQSRLMTKSNVVGVGVGLKDTRSDKTDEICVKVLVTRKLSPEALLSGELVPKEVDGIRTDVIQVGDLRALQTPKSRWRPAPGGVSIGHYQITAGTLGCIVRDRDTGEPLILSNNHVLANSNDANIGDAILQPGPTDGGKVNSDTIATLLRFIPIQYTTSPGTCDYARVYASIGNLIAIALGSSHRVSVNSFSPQALNKVDAALARPNADSDVLDEIRGIGKISGVLEAELGMPLRKSGRTTDFTTDQVQVLEATVNVSYGTGRTATFEEQIVTGSMSQGGDSGSLVVHNDSPNAVGLLFAGSDQSSILSPIQTVLDLLNVTFDKE
ncbi:MAG: hypothetical protein HQ525_03575 [Anaerolineae bacterium]|nr:hypothetical protein [Anaerolineae bacterium]